MIDTEKPAGEITSFANTISAQMAGVDPEEYRKNHEKALKVLDKFEQTNCPPPWMDGNSRQTEKTDFDRTCRANSEG